MSGVRLGWPAAGALVVGLVGSGAVGAYLLLPHDGPGERDAPSVVASQDLATEAPVPIAVGSDARGTPLEDVTISLSPEAISRSGLIVRPVTMGALSGSLRLAAVVEPNAYRQVVVTPLVAGRVMRVLKALGDRVTQNEPLVEVYSPGRAEAQTRYLSMRADLDVAQREIARTERLVQIGAASQQELERLHAQHITHRADVNSARTQLQLLGMSPQQVDALTSDRQIAATTTVVAPIAGVVTARDINSGTTVEPATPLVTITDVSTVWVVGDVYEADWPSVMVGKLTTVTTTAYPDLKLTGRVSYIDPSIRPETRTARVRIEVPNPRQQLRFGMYAEIHVAQDEQTSSVLLVPSSAVQNVGVHTVVYLAAPDQPGQFIEREVRLGPSAGQQLQVLSGLRQGDQVVTEGSFSVKAERERLGLRPSR